MFFLLFRVSAFYFRPIPAWRRRVWSATRTKPSRWPRTKSECWARKGSGKHPSFASLPRASVGAPTTIRQVSAVCLFVLSLSSFNLILRTPIELIQCRVTRDALRKLNISCKKRLPIELFVWLNLRIYRGKKRKRKRVEKNSNYVSIRKGLLTFLFIRECGWFSGSPFVIGNWCRPSFLWCFSRF